MDMTFESTVAKDQFIQAMRNVASSVTVVTSDGPGGLCGATVSAFNSVSADPPSVLVCLFAQSRIGKAVQQNRSFCVNVLPESGQYLADRFAGRHDDMVHDRFSGIEIIENFGRSPALPGSTSFDCRVTQIVQSGSHLITIGEVLAVSDHHQRPLAYHNGAYQRIVAQHPSLPADT